MHPGDETFVNTEEYAADVSMEILGVTLGQEWYDICDSSTLCMHPGDETFVKT